MKVVAEEDCEAYRLVYVVRREKLLGIGLRNLDCDGGYVMWCCGYASGNKKRGYLADVGYYERREFGVGREENLREDDENRFKIVMISVCGVFFYLAYLCVYSDGKMMTLVVI
ncbi:unnamed protein product [Vicia faba]|uniref:Transmembrane protein n=1 Tax=Vicia faba TaxID=3906 RepID=A0AAV0ZJR8_VICFA|nr:unnamed protein product [Vicia faba]